MNRSPEDIPPEMNPAFDEPVMKFVVYVILMEDTNESFEQLADTFPESFDRIDGELDKESAEALYQQAKDLAYQ